ncbi:MAG: ATP-binding cassette domain-containing protein [Anaerolineales bacterium]|nr:ATP-binding cassette domain-containing protein [Anaerolineales bacterium]
MSTLIEIRDLLVQRGRIPVLEIEHLLIPRGTVTALVGANGAGKTTLLLVLARLLKPVRGAITFAGQPLVNGKDRDYRRRIGLVMQEALPLDRSVFNNVAVGLRFRGLAKKEIAPRVDAWLERLGVAHLRHRRATQLSGGEARRIALARAFVLEPELLLLDEPFQSLDRAAHQALLADLGELLPRTHTTVIFSSHNPQEVRRLAQEKITLEGGRIKSTTRLPKATPGKLSF